MQLSELKALDVPSTLVKRRSIDNGRVQLRLNAQGYLAALCFDRYSAILKPGAGSFVIYPDQPAHHPAWEIDRQTLAQGSRPKYPATISRTSGGLIVKQQLTKRSWATTRYTLDPGAIAVRIEIDLDWQDPETLLKFHIPTGYQGQHVRCGLPFGSLLRAQQPLSPLIDAKWEFPASRYVSVTDDNSSHGIALVTESHYGFSCVDGDLAVSLLRSPLQVGDDHYAPSYPVSLRRRITTRYSDLGRHKIHMAIVPSHANAPLDEQPAVLAETLFTPLMRYIGRSCQSPFRGLSGTDTLMPSWIQPCAPHQCVVRLHELVGQQGQAKLDLAAGWVAEKTNLLGEPQSATRASNNLPFAPFEIVSLLLTKST
jgi:alpha-mannosidase